MTEEQARITQCCGPEGCGYFNDTPRPARWCVASDCMAWRTYKVPASLGPEPNSIRLEREEGFCGLAGKP